MMMMRLSKILMRFLNDSESQKLVVLSLWCIKRPEPKSQQCLKRKQDFLSAQQSQLAFFATCSATKRQMHERLSLCCCHDKKSSSLLYSCFLYLVPTTDFICIQNLSLKTHAKTTRLLVLVALFVHKNLHNTHIIIQDLLPRNPLLLYYFFFGKKYA